MAREAQRDATRRAILGALAEVVADSGVLGFSVQEVADRAGVTHRTVYNHFPTRNALNDAFGVHVEERLAETLGGDGQLPPDPDLTFASLAELVTTTYQAFEVIAGEVHVNVALMLATGAEAQVTNERTARLAAVLCDELGLDRGTARRAAAALRMFLSSTGWHLLRRQLGLTAGEAVATAAWAVRALAADLERGGQPNVEDDGDDGDR